MRAPSFQIKLTRSWAIKAGLSALVLGVVLSFLPLDQVLEGFSRLPLGLFFGVLALFMAGHVVASGKWWMLIGQVVPFVAAVRAHFAGLAANLCLPGVAGGDVVRAGLIWKAAAHPGKIMAGSLGDRLVDMLSLGLVAAGGAAMLAAGGDMALVGWVVGALTAACVAVFYILPLVVPMLVRALPLPKKVAGLAQTVAAAFGELGKRPVALIGALVLSVAVQAGFVMLTILIAEAIGVEAPRAAWFFAWPLAKLLAVLPISLAGIGVREASLAALLTPFGAAAAGVVAASLIWQAVLFSAGIIGAIAWAMTSGSPSASGADLKSEGV